MRDDFAKQLVERERHGHSRHYGQVRGLRAFKHVDEYFGGRESMKARHNLNYNTKSFNENLNPLWGWLRSVVGKKWDKSYGELRKKFDARSTVNAHILQHLFQEVETNAYLNDKGAVMCLVAYRYGTTEREVPISQCSKDYYVCPKDGTLKVTKKQPRRSVIKQREAELLKEQLAKGRLLADGSELRKGDDGIWYHYTFAVLPKAKVTYTKPHGVNVFEVKLNYGGRKIQKSWNELNETERARHGVKVYDIQGVVDVETGVRVAPSEYKEQRYAATKRTAPRALLRKHGLDGTAAANDESILSHRDVGKYRKAA